MWICNTALAVLTLLIGLAGFTSTAQEPLAPPKKAEASPRPPRDLDGDPLPAGAVARLGSLRYRHEDNVTRMVISGDGKFLATVSPGRPSGVEIWNLADGKLLRRYSGPSPRDLALLPDGKTLVIGHWLPGDGAVFVDMATGKQFKRITTPDATQKIAVSPDGKTLATWSLDWERESREPTGGKNVVGLFDIATGKLLKRIERKHDMKVVGNLSSMRGGPSPELEFWEIRFLAFTADGKSIASGTWDKSINLWDTKSGEWVREFFGLKQPAFCFAFSDDGKSTAAACTDRTVRGYDLAKGTELFNFSIGMQSVRCLAFSRDGKALAVGGSLWNGAKWMPGAAIWEIPAGKRIRELPTWGQCMAFTPDNKTLIACDGAIKLIDTTTGENRAPADGHQRNVQGLAFTPDGQTLISEGGDRTVRYWNMKTGKQIRQYDGLSVTHPTILVFSPDGTKVAHRTDDRKIVIRDTRTGRDVHTLIGHAGVIYPVRFLPDGKSLVSAERDGPAFVWNVADGSIVRRIPHPFGSGESVALSADGALLAVAKRSFSTANMGPHLIDVIDTANGTTVGKFSIDKSSSPAAMAFSPNKKTLFAGMHGNLVCILDMKTGKETRRFNAHGSSASVLTVSPDGTMLATGGHGWFAVWDAKTGRKCIQQRSHGHSIFSLAFSPDNRLLASGGADSTILLWEIPKDWRVD